MDLDMLELVFWGSLFVLAVLLCVVNSKRNKALQPELERLQCSKKVQWHVFQNIPYKKLKLLDSNGQLIVTASKIYAVNYDTRSLCFFQFTVGTGKYARSGSYCYTEVNGQLPSFTLSKAPPGVIKLEFLERFFKSKEDVTLPNAPRFDDQYDVQSEHAGAVQTLLDSELISFIENRNVSCFECNGSSLLVKFSLNELYSHENLESSLSKVCDLAVALEAAVERTGQHRVFAA